MIVTPKIRGFVCTTAHPAGCRAHVKQQIDYVKSQPAMTGAKKVLVVGSSAGYGLASMICSAFGCGASTIGVMHGRPATGSRTASASWYNVAAFQEFAAQEGLYAKTVHGDAFAKETKDKMISLIREDLGQVDLVVYSVAAPRRTTADGESYTSVLKTTGESYTNKTIDLKKNTITQVTIDPATQEEIDATVKVMGGEDWLDWMTALSQAGVLAPNATTVAYSYVGPELTHPMYLKGSIGCAKAHLLKTAQEMGQHIPGVQAFVSVNKALVTQSSAAIPVVPLYIALLYKVMKEKGLHEGCIEQMQRMYADRLAANPVPVDEEGRIRMDDWEMRPDVQEEVSRLWQQVTSENIQQLGDIEGYWKEFYEMFGFGIPGVDYEADVDIQVDIPGLVEA